VIPAERSCRSFRQEEPSCSLIRRYLKGKGQDLAAKFGICQFKPRQAGSLENAESSEMVMLPLDLPFHALWFVLAFGRGGSARNFNVGMLKEKQGSGCFRRSCSSGSSSF